MIDYKMGTFWILTFVLVLGLINVGTTQSTPKNDGQWQWLDCSQHCDRCVNVLPESCASNETFFYDGDPCGCCDACIIMSDVGEPCLHAMSMQKTVSHSRVVVSTKVCREGLICLRGLCISRQKTPCNTENRGLSYISRCDSEGFFMPIQCSGSHCWCVNKYSGKPIANSKRPWDYYWIKLDARFGCPAEKDVNQIFDSDEDENSSRWRRSVENFRSYSNLNEPVTEIKELYSNAIQLKLALKRLSKDDMNLLKKLIQDFDKKSSVIRDDYTRDNFDLESNDYESIPPPKSHKEMISHHLIQMVLDGPTNKRNPNLIRNKRRVPEHKDAGKIVLEMKIDCPAKISTTTLSTITENTTETPVNGTKTKSKRKLRRKKPRVTRSIDEKSDQVNSFFQQFWESFTQFFQRLYNSFLRYFSNGKTLKTDKTKINNTNIDNDNVINVKSESNNSDGKIMNKKPYSSSEEGIFDKDIQPSFTPSKKSNINFDCKNLSSEECKLRFNQIFKKRSKRYTTMKKRGTFYYYYPNLKRVTEKNNNEETDSMNSIEMADEPFRDSLESNNSTKNDEIDFRNEIGQEVKNHDGNKNEESSSVEKHTNPKYNSDTSQDNIPKSNYSSQDDISKEYISYEESTKKITLNSFEKSPEISDNFISDTTTINNLEDNNDIELDDSIEKQISQHNADYEEFNNYFTRLYEYFYIGNFILDYSNEENNDSLMEINHGYSDENMNHSFYSNDSIKDNSNQNHEINQVSDDNEQKFRLHQESDENIQNDSEKLKDQPNGDNLKLSLLYKMNINLNKSTVEEEPLHTNF